MFYVKQQVSGNAEIRIDITDDNVFCRCPKCGRETRVYLDEVLRGEDSDLYGTAVFCDECSRAMKKGGGGCGCE